MTYKRKIRAVNKFKLRKIDPLPLGEGRVRVSRFNETCHPQLPLKASPCRARASPALVTLPQREREYTPRGRAVTFHSDRCGNPHTVLEGHIVVGNRAGGCCTCSDRR